MYRKALLTELHYNLYYEYYNILDFLNIDKKDVVEILFLYNDNNHYLNYTAINNDNLYKEEEFMYNVKNDFNLEILELPLYYDKLKYSYIIIYLLDKCVVARYGTNNIYYEKNTIHFLLGKKYFSLDDVIDYIYDINVKNLIITHFNIKI
jgi:hypothetical protein